MNLEKTAVITLDTDWVPVSVMEYIVEEIMPAEIPATFFVTNPYPILQNREDRNWEFSPHTNPPDLQEETLAQELERKMAFCSGKVYGHRGHSLYWSERLRPLFRQKGIRYESSTMMYLESGIHPFQMGYDLLQIPLFYMDYFNFEYCEFSGEDAFNLDRMGLDKPGLKVFDFHPIHLYINTPDLDYYSSVKSHYQQPEQLNRLRYQGYGTCNSFIDILEQLKTLGYQFTTLEEICKSVQN